jgi:hypothetical protein
VLPPPGWAGSENPVVKFYPRHQAYWYGVNPSSYQQAKALGCTDFIFIMGDDGFVTIPLSTVDNFLNTA